MKRLSVSEFKRRFSHWIQAVEAGETFEVTRHNRTIARIGPAEASLCHTGESFGKGGIRSLFKHPGILESLLEDRRGGPER